MPDQSDRIVQMESPLGDSRCAVTALTGEERINDLYSFAVTVIADADPILPQEILGEEVTLTIRFSDVERPVHGIVARFEELDPVGHNEFEYRLEIVPPLWLLGLSAHTRIFEDMKSTDIVKAVIADACNMAVEDNTTRSFSTRETCLQYNETDLDFVLRLLGDDGITFYFAHSAGSVNMVMTDAATGFPDCSPSQYTYRERDVADWAQAVSGFRRFGRLATGSLENRDYSEYAAPTPRSAVLTSRTTGKLRPGRMQTHAGQYFERSGNGRNLTGGDCDTRAQRWLEGLEADAEYYTGQSAAPSLVPGHKMTLSDAPVCSDGDTQYLILEVQHMATEGLDANTSYSNRLRCAPSSNSVAFRPVYVESRPRIWGVQTAVVVEVRPIPGAGVHAEVKVQFPWFEDGISCWARVAQLYAGNKWGGYFVPELEQEVLVEFIAGDPDRPVVVGAVYNSKNAIPPYNKWQSGIRTRSGSYNELLFTDEPGAEVFYTEAGKDYKFLVHNDQTGDVTNNRAVNIGNDDSLDVGHDLKVTVGNNMAVDVANDISTTCTNQTETISAERSADVGSNDKLSVGANLSQDIGNNLDVTAGMNVDVSAGMNVKIEANTQIQFKCGASEITMTPAGITIKSVQLMLDGTMVDINGKAMTQVKSSAMLMLKGGITMIN